MFQGAVGFPTLHVCASAVLAIVGLWVLLRRSRRRIGSEPRCGQWEYILEGIGGDRCPECGWAIDPVRVVRGAMRRRRGVMIVGVVLVLTAVGTSWNRVEEWAGAIYWYQYKPTFLVMRDYENGAGLQAPSNPLQSTRWLYGLRGYRLDLAGVALDELFRREKAGTLSQRYRRELDEVAWAKLTAHDRSLQPELTDDLAGRLVAGKLTAELTAQIYRRCVTVGLSTDPVVAKEVGVPIRVQFISWLPGESGYPLYTRATFTSLRFDGREVDDPRRWFGSGSAIVSHYFNVDIARRVWITQPGKHRIDLDVDLELCHGRDVLHRETRHLSTSFVKAGDDVQK